MNVSIPWFAVGVAGLSLAYVVSTKLHSRKSLPPGPAADPFIGHLRKIPPVQQAEVFHEWAKQHGSCSTCQKKKALTVYICVHATR